MAIAKKIQEMKSRLPDKEGVKQMVKIHDDYKNLASRHKGALPSLDPLIRNKIIIESQYLPMIDVSLPTVIKTNRLSIHEKILDQHHPHRPGQSAFTKSPSE